jgi:hypothetical protein
MPAHAKQYSQAGSAAGLDHEAAHRATSMLSARITTARRGSPSADQMGYACRLKREPLAPGKWAVKPAQAVPDSILKPSWYNGKLAPESPPPEVHDAKV